MPQCKVELENCRGAYYPGNEIKGRVVCYFNGQTSFRAIKIRLKCKEHNEWTGRESYYDHVHKKRRTRYITLKGDHDILFLEQMLVGSSFSGSGSHVLNSGRHVFPFQFSLPTDIPSSFTGPHGSITFKLKAVVDIPMAFDYEDTFIFKVVSPIDFNDMPRELQECNECHNSRRCQVEIRAIARILRHLRMFITSENPASYSDEKTVCCWCCQGGNVTMDVELAKTAFIPGEIIPLKVRVSNLSNSNVENVRVRFVKTVKYKVTRPRNESREDEEEILSHREHGVGAHGEHIFNMQLEIPQHIVVPNFTRCELFKVKYVMTVTCEMPCCTLDLDVEIWDIKLGHVQWRRRQAEGSATAFGSNSHSNLPPMDSFHPPPLPPAPVSSELPPYPSAPSPEEPSAPPAYEGVQQPAGQPSAPMEPTTEPPPPSYEDVQKSNNYYPPR